MEVARLKALAKATGLSIVNKHLLSKNNFIFCLIKDFNIENVG